MIEGQFSPVHLLEVQGLSEKASAYRVSQGSPVTFID